MRLLTFIHRWLGVGLCLLFCAWFLSGIVMIYQPFPSLSDHERYIRSDAIAYDTKLQSLNQLLVKKMENPNKVTLNSALGEPYYWWQDFGNDLITVIHAESGEPLQFDFDQIREIAKQFHPEKPIKTIHPPVEYDQWIVSNRFDPFRPFYRIDFDDAEKTNIYVSSRNAHVLQQTTKLQRGWNYVGAVVHWIYPTLIRKHWALWDQLVWWLALAGIVSAVTGMTLGVINTCKARRSWSNYEGWLHWHHLGGLIAGILVFSWIFSGWLSMDHGRIFSIPDPTSEQTQAYLGAELNSVLDNLPEFESAISDNTREIELRVIAGEPYLLSKSTTEGYQTWLLNEQGRWQQHEQGLPHQLLQKAITSAWPHSSITEFAKIDSDDVYAHLREGDMGPNVLRAVLADPDKTWIHVDSFSGEIVSVMNSNRRVYRWLFNGLHSLDLPGLTSRPLLWYGVMLSFLGLGTLFSATGAVLGIRRLLR